MALQQENKISDQKLAAGPQRKIDWRNPLSCVRSEFLEKVRHRGKVQLADSNLFSTWFWRREPHPGVCLAIFSQFVVAEQFFAGDAAGNRIISAGDFAPPALGVAARRLAAAVQPVVALLVTKFAGTRLVVALHEVNVRVLKDGHPDGQAAARLRVESGVDV